MNEENNVPNNVPENNETMHNSGSKPAKKEFKFNTPMAIVTGAVLIAIVLLFKMPSAGKVATNPTQNAGDTTPTTVDPKVLTIRPTDHVYGDPTTAKVIFFEYSDSDCPYCQQFHPTVEKIMTTYGKDIAWVYRYFPLSIHPDSHNEAIALECSAQLGGNTTFFKFLDKAMGVTVTPDQSAETMIGLATSLGLDKKLFTQCIQNKDSAAQVDSDSNEAQAIGAQGTPFSILVNKAGKQVVIPGAYPYDAVKAQVDSLMK